MSEQALRIAVAGATGRMGRMLITATREAGDLRLHSALDHPDSPGVGQDAGAGSGVLTGVVVDADLHRALRGADVLIDFTRPEATLAHLAVCRELGVKMVIGTTGFTGEQQAQIADASQHVAVVSSPNMSVGVNVVLRLLDQAARALRSGYDIEIVEAHHRHKVDAPSGTALRMGEVIAAAQGRTLNDCAVYAREGVTGERREGSIGFATVRGGDIVGDHLVLFAGPGERIEISHKASSRDGYARGSLLAARFLRDKSAGQFGMSDVLGLA